MKYPIALVLAASALLHAQDPANLTVTVVDPSNFFVPGAQITVTDARRGTIRTAKTTNTGYAYFDHLAPSEYNVDVEKAGFQKIRLERVVLNIRDRQTVRVALTVAAASNTSVNVIEKIGGISSDPANGISIDQNYAKHLPINGRNVENLILMTPGVTSASGGIGGVTGGFNANGLRSNTNYYTIDGVSTNNAVGLGGGGGGGPLGGGGAGILLGGAPAAGASTELLSIDSMQELRVQTSSFAPEFGRTPGAQVSMTSRSGTNDYHGNLSYYFRNDRFNANDWFANSTGLPRPEMRQNRISSTLGGALVKDRTYFFASYEYLGLRSPQTAIVSVPDAETRRNAPRSLTPFLNAFPVANGPALDDGAAQFRAVFSNPSRTHSSSLRIDQIINSRWTAFARIAVTPASSSGRLAGFTSPNMLTNSNSHSYTGTVGLTADLGNGAVNDLRVNYSRSSGRTTTAMDNFGGAVPLNEALVFPSNVTSATGQFSLNVIGLTGYTIGGRAENQQTQLNVVDTYTKVIGPHHYKLGVDVRRITPTYFRRPYTVSASFNGLSGEDGALISGQATNAIVAANVTEVYPVFLNFSAYAQETFRVSERTTLTYGIRWDVNPPPTTRKGDKPFAVATSSVAGVTQNESLYDTKWANFAPRFGLAYQVDTTPGREMMFRTGLGVFYDLGYGVTAGAFSGAPYSSQTTYSLINFPLSTDALNSPTLPPTRPYGQITAAERSLKAPLVYQWNMTVEKNYGRSQTLTVAYSGTKGTRLMRTEAQPSFSDAYDILTLATNGAQSLYNGLQVQFRKRLNARLQTQFSYTWAHSLDTASGDLTGGGGFATLLGYERGSSDYDIRHNINWSGSYAIPVKKVGFWTEPLRNWNLDWVATLRTGLPFDVRGVSSEASSTTAPRRIGGRGLFAQVRPNYTGLDVWIDDPNAPGGRRLNAAAFEIPDDYSQGNLGRNALRGFGSQQIDLSLRRTFPISEHIRLDLGASAYNVLNHPNFANPSPQEGANLSSATFGIMSAMQSSAGGLGGISTAYRSGGSRTVEFSLRLQF